MTTETTTTPTTTPTGNSDQGGGSAQTPQPGQQNAVSNNESQTLIGGAAGQQTNNDQGQNNSTETLLGGAKGDDQNNGSQDAPKETVPENYTDFTLPEGVQLGEETVGEFKTMAKEFGLTQTQAQKLVDLQVKHSEATTQRILTDYNKKVDEWKKEASKTFGPQMNDHLSKAAKALDRLEGGSEIRKILNDTGFGNHPSFIKFLSSIGARLSEDTMTGGGQTRTTPKSTAEIFYPNMK